MRTDQIIAKVVIPAPPALVYEAFVSAKKHAAFTGSPATSEERVGGKFSAWDGYISGRYLELEPGKRIVAEWQTTEWPEGYPPSRLELVFTPQGKGTEINMSHTAVPAEQKESYARGWEDFYWEPLRQYFK
jgi:uncharacterized protein YndB with AHSA1/START domain